MNGKISCNCLRDVIFHIPVKSYILKMTFQHLESYFYYIVMDAKKFFLFVREMLFFLLQLNPSYETDFFTIKNFFLRYG